jgi:hypothetical protein
MADLTGSGANPVFKDRRTFPRRRPRGSAAVLPADKPMAPGTAAVLTNISQGGIGFIIRKELVLGQRVILEMQAPGLARPLPIRAEVRWVVPDQARPGYFRVGAAWLERLQYHHLVHFV